jgi:hypothetical protein
VAEVTKLLSDVQAELAALREKVGVMGDRRWMKHPTLCAVNCHGVPRWSLIQIGTLLLLVALRDDGVLDHPLRHGFDVIPCHLRLPGYRVIVE